MEKEKQKEMTADFESQRPNDFVFPLKEGQVLVTGVAPYEKDGKRSFTLSGIQCYQDFQSDNGAYGYEAVLEWTNRVDLGFLNVGDIIEMQYGKGFKGAAILINCKKVNEIAGNLTLKK